MKYIILYSTFIVSTRRSLRGSVFKGIVPEKYATSYRKVVTLENEAIRTNLGPIPPPTDDCYGYVWTEDGWRVKAERARVPVPGGGHGRRGREEEDGRRRQRRK